MDNSIGMDPVPGQVQRQPIRVDGPEITQLGNLYKDRGDITENEWDAVVTTAARVISQSPDPGGPGRQVTGLALGKVQSGKTLSYTAVTALAVDNGFRITIVLAGTKNPLRVQTYNRLVRDLNLPKPGLVPFENPLPQDSEVIRSILHNGGHVLIVVLKNRKRIDNVTLLLDSPELRNHPTLIIDDEGDEASLNTQFRSGRRSAIYNSILRLRSILPLHAYLAYTATPQANLLINGLDELAPNFAELIDPGSGYCGGNVFFGRDSNRYLRTIPLAGDPAVQATQITPQLRFAIALFLVGGAIRWLRGDQDFHSALIHTSSLTVDHIVLQRSVNQLISLWKDIFALPSTDPSRQDLVQLMRNAYDDLRNTVENIPAWEDIETRLRDEVWSTEVWMVNSLPIGRDPIAVPFRLKNNILVGGNMLGRGVTLRGLAVTYITREALQETNADTLEQRARWFGYKQRYLDVCRIFLTATLRGRYSELLQHEDDFWEALKRNQQQGISVSEWPRMFRLDMSTWLLRPTRSQVANYKEFHSAGWDIQRKVIMDPAVGAQNVQAIRNFIANHPGTPRRFGNVEHLVIPNVTPEMIISDLLSNMNLEGSDWDKAYIEEYLTRLRLGNRLQAMDVVIMSGGEFRNRTADAEGNINPMQGRSPNRAPGAPEFYPGDESINNGQPQLQIHLIRVRETDTRPSIDTSAFALYLPDDQQYDLRMVVRG